jgi:hypothetical protein
MDFVGGSKKAYERDFDVIGDMDTPEGTVTFRLSNTRYIGKHSSLAVATGKSVFQRDRYDESERLEEIVVVHMDIKPLGSKFFKETLSLNPGKTIYMITAITSHLDEVDPTIASALVSSIIDSGIHLIIDPSEHEKRMKSRFSSAYSVAISDSENTLELPGDEGPEDDESKDSELSRIKELSGVSK